MSVSVPSFFRFDFWLQNALGAAIAGQSVYLCSQPANTSVVPPSPLASIFADPLGAVPVIQPLTSDGQGHVDCYAAPGTYALIVVVNGTITNVYPDQSIGIFNASASIPASGNSGIFATALASLSTAPAGDILTADGSGNAQDSGVSLSSIPLLSSVVVLAPSADQTITAHNLIPAASNTTQSLGLTTAPWNAVFNTELTIGQPNFTTSTFTAPCQDNSGNDFSFSGAIINTNGFPVGCQRAVGIQVPSSSTLATTAALMAMANNASTTSDVCGIYCNSLASVTGASVWGINPLVQDAVGISADVVQGMECDINILGTPTLVRGILIAGNSSGTMPSATGNALQITMNGTPWNRGIVVQNVVSTGQTLISFAYKSATSGANYPVAPIELQSQEWNGSSSIASTWSIGVAMAASGEPTTEYLSITNSGSVATNPGVQVPNLSVLGASIFSAVPANGVRFTPTGNTAGTTAVYGTNAANSAVVWSFDQAGNLSCNGVTLASKITAYNDISTAGNGVPSEVFQVLNSALTANYNSGSAKTLFTPTAAGMWRISAVEASGNTPTGATLPSLTVGWTDVSGIARTLILLASTSTSASTTMNQASMVIYTNGSTAVTVTSAAYAAGSGTALSYNLAVTAEAL